MILLRINQLSLALILGAFTASLFFNGIDIRYFALVFVLLVGWLLTNGIRNYHKGYEVGNSLIPVSLFLFWLWLGINIVFSQVFYLSVVNFWWVGIFPLVFFGYSLSTDKDVIWQRLLPTLVGIVVILGFYALYQAFALQEEPRATFYNKNSLAALINLLFFPILIYALIKTNSSRRIVSAAIIFLFILLLALINSRGALLAFGIGMLTLLAFGWSQIKSRQLLIISLVIISAFISASLLKTYSPNVSETGVVERIATLQDTESAGHTRFVIWQPAWDLFKQHPWRGIGLGCYFLAIPPFLHNDDHSAGFYVHNDYLQIALETGIPGFLFLLLVLLATLFRFINTLRSSSSEHPQYLQLLALFSALLTLAAHSAFTYNLYVLPIMLLAGVLLARFNYIADQLTGRQLRYFSPAKYISPYLYYSILVFMTVILASYFLSIGLSHHYQQKGYQLIRAGQLKNAHQAFNLAQKLTPSIDSIYTANADLLRKSALLLVDRPEMATVLLQDAKELLNKAEKLNTLRAQTPYIRGLVLEQDPTVTGADIIQTYQTALKRNPRFIPARLALARFLLAHENNEEAYQILQQGLVYNYRQLTPAYLDFIEMNYAVAISLGDQNLARTLAYMLEISRQDFAALLSTQKNINYVNPY